MTPTPSPSVAEAIRRADGLRATVQRVDQAVDEAVAAVAAARAKHEESAAALAELDDALVLATDDVAARAIEARMKRATAADNDARTALDRAVRIEAARRQQLQRVEADRDTEIPVLRLAVSQHASEVASAIDAEIAAAVVPLKAALRRAAVLQLAAPSVNLGHALADIMVPSAAGYGLAHVDGLRGIADDWQTDAAMVVLHVAASQPRDALGRLEAHVSREARKRAQWPAKATGYTHGGDRTQRAPKPAATDAPAPTPTPRMRSMPPVEMDMGAAALADPDLAQFR